MKKFIPVIVVLIVLASSFICSGVPQRRKSIRVTNSTKLSLQSRIVRLESKLKALEQKVARITYYDENSNNRLEGVRRYRNPQYRKVEQLLRKQEHQRNIHQGDEIIYEKGKKPYIRFR